MMNPTYDDALELQLNSLICFLDTKPVICTNPVEASTYLNFDLVTSEEGFQQQIEIVYNNFMTYLNTFVKACLNSNSISTPLAPTLARLLTAYKHTHYIFKHSDERIQWKNQAKYFSLPNSENDWLVSKEEKYTRWAYNFFYNCSARQLFFIEKLIDDISTILKNIVVENSVDSVSQTALSLVIPEKKYHFTIRPEAKKHIYNILQFIHKNLKDKGYIDCTLPQFRQIFESEDPKPVLWMKPYNHLTYLIKRMSEKFLATSKSSSNYEIAAKFLLIKTNEEYYKPKKNRYDKAPNRIAQEIIDHIISNSIDYYLMD